MKRRRLVCVIGPSGAGKDSVLRWVSEHAPRGLDLHIARRTASRVANGPSEDHEALSVAEFQRLASEGAFALHWQVDELQCGVRYAELDPLRRSAWVLVNGSGAYLPQARQRSSGGAALRWTPRKTQRPRGPPSGRRPSRHARRGRSADAPGRAASRRCALLTGTTVGSMPFRVELDITADGLLRPLSAV